MFQSVPKRDPWYVLFQQLFWTKQYINILFSPSLQCQWKIYKKYNNKIKTNNTEFLEARELNNVFF